jgi:hypothetical protein
MTLTPNLLSAKQASKQAHKDHNRPQILHPVFAGIWAPIQGMAHSTAQKNPDTKGLGPLKSS